MKSYQKCLFFIVLGLVLQAFAPSAFARTAVCPVAYVQHYMEEEMQDYIDALDFKDILIEKSTWPKGSTFFLIVPTDATSTISLYKAMVTNEGKVLPNHAASPIVETKPGWALLFRYEPPGSIPEFIAELTEATGKKYTWVPDFSGMDGKLLTSKRFVLLPTSFPD